MTVGRPSMTQKRKKKSLFSNPKLIQAGQIELNINSSKYFDGKNTHTHRERETEWPLYNIKPSGHFPQESAAARVQRIAYSCSLRRRRRLALSPFHLTEQNIIHIHIVQCAQHYSSFLFLRAQKKLIRIASKDANAPTLEMKNRKKTRKLFCSADRKLYVHVWRVYS